MVRKFGIGLGEAALAIAFGTGPVMAQDILPAPGHPNSVIIVTSEKREQDLQDVASSVAVIGSSNIGETGKDSFADYINTVPGLSVASGGPGYTTLAIRGITTGRVRQDEPQNKETVGIYLDDAPISVNGFNPDFGLFDIARIEVLRGPQGTYYGSGSMGGTIRIITNPPDTDKSEGLAEGTISDTSHGGINSDLRGMLNLPIAFDALALRATAYRTDYDGYLDNRATGERNVNDARSHGGRIQLGARLGEDFEANLTFMIHDLKTGARSEESAPHSRAVRAFDGNSDNLKLYSARLNYDLDGATITSATSYLDKRNVNRLSLEFLLANALGFDSASPLVDTTQVRDFTQEVRIATDGQGVFNVLFGLFFQHHRRGYAQDGIFPGLDDFIGVAATDLGTPQADQIFYGTQTIDQKQWAAFGEVSYKLLPGLTATAGLRAFKFREGYDTYSSGLLNGGVASSSGRTADSGVTPKFVLTFRPDENNLLYVLASKGFRLGGVNTTVPLDLCRADLDVLGRADAAGSFAADSVWNFEVGSKNQSADQKFTLNASAYYIKWNNMQTTLTLPTCFFAFRNNVGEAHSLGIELEGRFRPAPRTELFGSFGFTDSRLTQDVPFTSWQSGDRVPSVSPVQVNLGLRQGFSLQDGDASFIRLDYSFVSRAHSNFDMQDPTNRQFNDYGLFNVALGLEIPNSPFELTLFARNLFNSHGRVAAYDGNVVAPERYVTVRPRTIGATLRARFAGTSEQ